jgi:hypothetical protein
MEYSTEDQGAEPTFEAHGTEIDSSVGSEYSGAASSAMQQQMPMKVAEESIDDPRVAAAIERLDDLDELPVHEHVAVFTDVQSRLTEALSSVGDAD